MHCACRGCLWRKILPAKLIAACECTNTGSSSGICSLSINRDGSSAFVGKGESGGVKADEAALLSDSLLNLQRPCLNSQTDLNLLASMRAIVNSHWEHECRDLWNSCRLASELEYRVIWSLVINLSLGGGIL